MWDRAKRRLVKLGRSREREGKLREREVRCGRRNFGKK